MARSQVDVAGAVKDAAYISIGLGVIALQRFRVRRNELTRSLNPSGDASGLDKVSAVVGDRVKVLEERISSAFDRNT